MLHHRVPIVAQKGQTKDRPVKQAFQPSPHVLLQAWKRRTG